MQRNISHTIEIDATPAEVWGVLTDFESFEEWNPFVRRAEGELREGARLEVEIEPPGGRAVTLRPTLLELAPEHELRWLGRIGVRGIFDGEHSFQIEPLPNNRTRFTQGEQFNGILVRPFAGTLTKTENGFALMNEALKERAETA